MSGAGRAPEILQSQHLKSLGVDFPTPSPPSAAPAPPSPPTAVEESSAELPSAVSEAEPTDPKVLALETLPDEELIKEAKSRGVRIDGRWSRGRIIAEILAPPVVVEPAAPAPPTASAAEAPSPPPPPKAN